LLLFDEDGTGNEVHFTQEFFLETAGILIFC